MRFAIASSDTSTRRSSRQTLWPTTPRRPPSPPRLFRRPGSGTPTLPTKRPIRPRARGGRRHAAAIAAASNAVMHAQQPQPLPHAQAFATPQGMQIMQGPDGRNYQVLPLPQQQQQFMQQQQIMQLQQQQQQQQQQAIQQQMALQQQHQQQMAAGGGGVQQPIANINAPPPGSATVAASLNLIAKDLGGTDLAAVHAYAQRLKEMRRSETPTNEGDGNNNLPTLRLQPPSEMPPVVGPIPGADTSTTYQSQPPPPPQQTLLTRPPTTTATTNNLPPMHLQPHLQTMPAGTDDHSMMIAAQAAIAQQQAQAQAAQAQAAQLAALQQAAQQQHSQEGAHAMPQLQPTGGGLAAQQPQQQPGAAQTYSTPTTTTATQQQAIDDLAAKSWAVVLRTSSKWRASIITLRSRVVRAHPRAQVRARVKSPARRLRRLATTARVVVPPAVF